MLTFLLVLAVLAAPAKAGDGFRDAVLVETASEAANGFTMRFYRDGEPADPPRALADSLTHMHHRGRDAIVEVTKTVLARHYSDSGYFSAEIDSIVFWDMVPDGSDAPDDHDGVSGQQTSTPHTNNGSRQPTLSIHVTVGCRYQIGSLNFRIIDDDQQLLDRFLRFYGEGDTFDRLALEAELRRAVRHLEEQGYPLANLEISNFHPDRELCRVDIDAGLRAGEALQVQGVVTSKVVQADAGYIETASGIRENDKITPDLFRSGRRNLENTGFFREVSDGDLLLRDGDAYIYYDVIEQRANHFDLLFGYVPGQSGGNDIVGRGEMKVRNVGWTGSTMHLMFERLDEMVTRLESGYEREWIGGLPLGAGVDFRFVQQDTSYQVRELHLMGSYRRTPERRYSIHLLQNTTAANDDPALPLSVLDGVTRAAGFGFHFDNTDSRFTPRSGMMFNLYVESGFRRVSDARAEELRSRGTMLQQRVRTSLKTFYSPFSRQVIALGIHGSLVESPEYTETDVVPLGGSRSIRGYREEQFRVARYAWADLEYRYLLDPLSHAFLFGAAGGYERPAMLAREETGSSGWLYSGGFGFRFQTPIGLMQFTYAVSAEDSLHNGKVHFSLTAGF